MKKKFFFLLFSFGILFAAKAQVINIPDTKLKNVLLNDLSINTNQNGDIEMSEASTVVSLLSLSGRSIKSIEGLQFFTNLQKLVISNNSITSINLTNFKSLQELRCANNGLTSLTIGLFTPNLNYIDCSNNSLTTLDLSNANVLRYLEAKNNKLISITGLISSSLIYLSCDNNLLAGIDVSALAKLHVFNCSNNLLTSLNAASNTELTSFVCNLNSSLSEICVSDAVAAASNISFQKDSAAIWTSNCLTGIFEGVKTDVLLYPNPATTHLYFDRSIQKISISDMLGSTNDFFVQQNNSVDISALSSGVYVVQLIDKENNVTIKKIVKE
ncbi:MAG: T9SS type A sorting domain-containing protein [Bacteroidetes bacterium]|nr:T9SS type A sorting domain-containing protein [Bacteroidota bacterium]